MAKGKIVKKVLLLTTAGAMLGSSVVLGAELEERIRVNAVGSNNAIQALLGSSLTTEDGFEYSINSDGGKCNHNQI